jgi:WD40 repeat protein
MKRLTMACAALALTAFACGTDTTSMGDDDDDVAQPDAGDLVATGLDGCLAGGGALTEVSVVDNNVLVAHGELTAMAFATTGQMAFASTDGAIKLWSFRGDAEGAIEPEVGYDTAFGEGATPIAALAYAPDASWLAAARGPSIELRDPVTGDELGGATLGEADLVSIAVALDGDRVAVADGSFAGNLRVWSRNDDTATEPLATELWGVTTVAFTPDGALITAGDWYGVPMVELRSAADPSVVVWTWIEQQLSGEVTDVAVSPDGARVAAAGDGFLVVIDTASETGDATFYRELIGPKGGPIAHLTSVAYTPGGAHLVTTDVDGAVAAWAADADTDALPGSMARDSIFAARTAPDYEQFVTADTTGLIHIVGCDAP